ncbi:MAG: hypothetical protein H3C47_09990 [Candidatus Cloacimonetes bacterium]|nr:hypothetical protein [Candidatus Cloacimonadota bacterium]
MFIEIAPEYWDNHSLNEILRACKEVRKTSDVSGLVLNLKHLSVIDSYGIVLLISLKEQLWERFNMNLKLAGLSSINQSILSASGLIRLLE